jgi:hypothetical protein
MRTLVIVDSNSSTLLLLMQVFQKIYTVSSFHRLEEAIPLLRRVPLPGIVVCEYDRSLPLSTLALFGSLGQEIALRRHRFIITLSSPRLPRTLGRNLLPLCMHILKKPYQLKELEALMTTA